MLDVTEKTDAARLDYSGPPLGYAVDCHGDFIGAIVTAWGRYKAHNDPPGMQVFEGEAGGAWWHFCVESEGRSRGEAFHEHAEARVAAWTWHDRRHALADRGLAYRGRGWIALNPWPRCMTWTDAEVADVERWLLDSTAEMPEMLRG